MRHEIHVCMSSLIVDILCFWFCCCQVAFCLVCFSLWFLFLFSTFQFPDITRRRTFALSANNIKRREQGSIISQHHNTSTLPRPCTDPAVAPGTGHPSTKVSISLLGVQVMLSRAVGGCWGHTAHLQVKMAFEVDTTIAHTCEQRQEARKCVLASSRFPTSSVDQRETAMQSRKGAQNADSVALKRSHQRPTGSAPSDVLICGTLQRVRLGGGGWAVLSTLDPRGRAALLDPWRANWSSANMKGAGLVDPGDKVWVATANRFLWLGGLLAIQVRMGCTPARVAHHQGSPYRQVYWSATSRCALPCQCVCT
jgi:hypothetical protein